VDPYTGEACGALGFSWTAALTLDLLHEPAGADRADLTGRADRTDRTDRTDQSTQVVSHPGRRAFDNVHGTPPHTSHASHTPHTPHSSFETGAKGGDRG
jgi:hypothetical protein